MNDILRDATKHALSLYGDGAAATFYAKLRERRFESTRCPRCGRIEWPPRALCSRCLSPDVEWVALPARGTLYAFTQQDARSTRFAAPEVIGLVDLDGVGRVLTRIDAAFDELRIGMPVELDFVDVGGGFVLHQFRPVKPREAP